MKSILWLILIFMMSAVMLNAYGPEKHPVVPVLYILTSVLSIILSVYQYKTQKMTVSKEESKALLFCKLLIVTLLICAWIVQWSIWTYGSLLMQIASGAFIVAMSLLLNAYTSPVWLPYFRFKK